MASFLNYLTIKRSNKAIAPLDGLRAFAVILVVFRHGILPFTFSEQPVLPIAGIDIAVPMINGWIGVDLFFVLSGFLITHHIYNKYLHHQSSISWGNYISRRLLRILPAYYTVLFLVISGVFHGYTAPVGTVTFDNFLYHILLLQDYTGSSILVVFWSLGVEEKFYLLCPFLLLALSRIKYPSMQYAIITLLFLSLPLIRYITSLYHPEVTSYPQFFQTFRSPFHVTLDGLLIGILCALIYRQKRHMEYLRKTVVPEILFWTGLSGIVIFLLWTNHMQTITIFDKVFLESFLALCFGSIVMGCLLGVRSNNFLSAKPLFYIGTLSYSLYLLHFALIPVTANITGLALKYFGVDWLASPFIGVPAFLALFFSLSLLATLLLYYSVEKPFLLLRDICSGKQ